MRFNRTVFDKCVVRAQKNGKCIKCGKRRKKSKTFMQTHNPFNKNEKGVMKSQREIYTELDERAEKWKAEPLVCAACEGGAG